MAKHTPDYTEGYKDACREVCDVAERLLSLRKTSWDSDFMKGWDEGHESALRNIQESFGWKELKQTEPAQ